MASAEVDRAIRMINEWVDPLKRVQPLRDEAIWGVPGCESRPDDAPIEVDPSVVYGGACAVVVRGLDGVIQMRRLG
jgi:hypothetical protein